MSDWDGEERRVSVTKGEVESLSNEVRALRDTLQTVYLSKHELLQTFPTKQEATRRRRGTALGLFVFILGFIQMHDLHVEYCGPGHRTERIVDVFLNEPLPQETLAQRMRDAGHEDVHIVCDITFPTHPHDDVDAAGNGQLIGYSIYGLALLLGIIWWRSEDDPKRKKYEQITGREVPAAEGPAPEPTIPHGHTDGGSHNHGTSGYGSAGGHTHGD